jgi:hypothetical protein
MPTCTENLGITEDIRRADFKTGDVKLYFQARLFKLTQPNTAATEHPGDTVSEQHLR